MEINYNVAKTEFSETMVHYTLVDGNTVSVMPRAGVANLRKKDGGFVPMTDNQKSYFVEKARRDVERVQKP